MSSERKSGEWLERCRHGKPERDCNACYDWARAQSETQECGTWRPPLRQYGRHYRLYLRGDLHRVDSVLEKIEKELGFYSPRVRVKLK